MSNHAWPDGRKSIFDMEGGGSASSTYCSLDYLKFWFDEDRIAQAFKRAGDCIVNSLEAGDSYGHPDELFMPVAYMYRHALEVKLKHFIRLASDQNLTGIYKSKILESHGLKKLWKQTRHVLIKIWPKEDKTPLNNIEAFVNDFIKIDGSGQDLRYSHKAGDTGNKTNKNYPSGVDLKELKDTFAGVFNLLGGCVDMLTDEKARREVGKDIK